MAQLKCIQEQHSKDYGKKDTVYTEHNNTIVVFSAAQFHMRCLFRCEIFISTHFIDYSHEFGDMNKYVMCGINQ